MPEPPLELARAQEVWELLAAHVRPGRTTARSAAEATGCVLARDVRASFDYPPFDRAVMDGFAVRSADVSGAPVALPVASLIQAGAASPEPLDPGSCRPINTGAPVPRGADAIVIVEDSVPDSAGRVLLRKPAIAGQHIERRGTLRRTGDLLVSAGTLVRPGTAAALIAGGAPHLDVFEPPSVAILTTGDELVAGGVSLRAGQIHDSNGVALAGLATDAGAVPRVLGRCPDELEPLRRQLSEGLQSDLLCVTGGMSRGSHDLVPTALESLGVTWLVTSLHLKPGKPTRIGRGPDGTWVLGLPGNPVSCAVCFLLFARPIINGRRGRGARPPVSASAELVAPLGASGARPMFHPACWGFDEHGRSRVTPIVWQGSGDPFGLAQANALIERPADAPAVGAGETVSVIPLGDLS